MKKQVQYAQTYQYKHINTNTYIIVDQGQNNSYTGKVYNQLPKTKHTQGVYLVKFTNVSKQTCK